ncbi:hypothetical protein L3X38_033698 [Prunus dulcis]|uniref:Uncharacterized protein n=1 Tax=Prunus dulcis TaxID=3755 RepID=A0AAD4YX59_PRUDU|nr:hypothetical protein L3X38_033698 [Prunus dulcis]
MLLHRLPHRQFCHISVSISFSSRLNDRFIGAEDWDPREESEEGDEDEEAKLVGVGGLVDDEVDMEDEVVAQRIGQYSIDKVKNEMTEGELENLRLEYGIPDTIELRLPKKDEKANGSIFIHAGFFESWKNKYFFASENWEFGEDDVGSGARVQTCFCRASGYLHVM